MHGLLESVPNFSEGRDPVVIEAIRAAMVDAGGRVLDVHSDPDHNRSVFTVVADADSLVDALAAAAQLHPSAGVVLVGVRPPLVAFNIDLETDDVEVARTIAAAIRERDGG